MSKKVIKKEENIVEIKPTIIETKLEEKRNFSIIEKETKQLKIIKKSEYNPEIHIAL